MCKEDIRIGRKLKNTSYRFTVAGGGFSSNIPSNPDRTAIRLSMSSAADQGGTIGGGFVPATGAVAETTLVNQPAILCLGYSDGTSIIALASVSSYSPTVVVKLEDTGSVLLGVLFLFNPGIALCIGNVVEVSLTEPLETV